MLNLNNTYKKITKQDKYNIPLVQIMPRTKKVVKVVGGGGSKDDIKDSKIEKTTRKKRAYRRKRNLKQRT